MCVLYILLGLSLFIWFVCPINVISQEVTNHFANLGIWKTSGVFFIRTDWIETNLQRKRSIIMITFFFKMRSQKIVSHIRWFLLHWAKPLKFRFTWFLFGVQPQACKKAAYRVGWHWFLSGWLIHLAKKISNSEMDLVCYEVFTKFCSCQTYYRLMSRHKMRGEYTPEEKTVVWPLRKKRRILSPRKLTSINYDQEANMLEAKFYYTSP